MRIYIFPLGISQKLNAIERVEFELTCNEVAVQHISH